MSAYTGRGPTKGRTHINDDVVTVVLRGHDACGRLSHLIRQPAIRVPCIR
jgi:hypothetical protein